MFHKLKEKKLNFSHNVWSFWGIHIFWWKVTFKESGAEKAGNQSLIGLAKQTTSLQDQLAGLKLEEYLGSEPVRDLQGFLLVYL